MYKQQKSSKLLDKIPEMFVNCEQSSYKVAFLIKKSYFLHFYPTDLVIKILKQLSPLRVDEQRWIYTSFLGDSRILLLL